jgi:hypothetical protein
MKQKITFLIVAAALAFQGCKKNDDTYIAPIIKGSQVITMGANYENVVYFKLGTQTTTSVPVASWDLAFESSGGTAVKSNIARKSGVYVTASTRFEDVTSVPTSAIAYDDPTGDLGKTAIGAWAANGNTKDLVYVIYRGNNPPNSAIPIGYKKFQIKGFANGKYTIRYADLDGKNEVTKEVAVNTAKNFTYFSLDNGIVNAEPDKTDWDIVFSCVTVPGGGRNSYVISPAVLSNRYSGVTVGIDDPGATLTASDDPAAPINTFASSNSNFPVMTLSSAASLNYSDNAMTIGRGWHQILMPHATGIYKIYDWKTYVVKSTDGNSYKLKLTAFKNLTTGEVGHPSFEYEQMQ